MDLKPFNVTNCTQWGHYVLKFYEIDLYNIVRSSEQAQDIVIWGNRPKGFGAYWVNMMVIDLSWDTWE